MAAVLEMKVSGVSVKLYEKSVVIDGMALCPTLEDRTVALEQAALIVQHLLVIGRRQKAQEIKKVLEMK